jgi:TRAP-type C4-dicarboxylate transport system permease small subunit
MIGYSRALDALERLLRLVILVFYSAIVVLVVFQVLNRFWLHIPIVWVSDLAVICFIWLGFLTAALAVRQDGHFRMSLLLDIFREGAARRALELFAVLMALTIFGLLLYTGYEMAWRGRREISPGLQMPMLWAYLAVPLSAALATLFCFERAFKEVDQRASSERAKAREEVEARL